MLSRIKKNLLPLIVFTTGACVLIIEVVAVRFLSPYFGNSIFTVSGVLSVILLALSLGYYYGGKLADQQPKKSWFFSIITASSIALLILYLVSVLVLPWLSTLLPISTGPLISAALFFLAPALLLGTLSPYAIKLQSLADPKAGIGAVSGRIYFWSTLGSISGSLAAGFVLIPTFGISVIFIGTSLVLFGIGLAGLLVTTIMPPRLTLGLSTLTILLALSSYIGAQDAWGQALYQTDGLYEKIIIYEGNQDGRPVRYLRQDQNSSSAMYLDTDNPTDLVYDYTRYYKLYELFSPEAKDTLTIGGAAYSVPRALLAELSEQASVDVAEVEPDMHSLAKEYFKLDDDPRLNNYVKDGRRLLADSNKNYDVIFGDAYQSLLSVPTHLTTKEFFELAKNRLNREGVLIVNFIGDLSTDEAPSLTFSEIKTFQSVFEHSYFLAVDSPDSDKLQNLIFIGHKAQKELNLKNAIALAQKDSIFNDIHEKLINTDDYDLSRHILLTDNYAPIDYLTAKGVQRTGR